MPLAAELGQRLPPVAGDHAHARVELVDQVGESANMAVLEGDAVVYVAQVPSPHSMRMFTEVGVQDATPQTQRWIRALACRAVWTARAPRPGPSCSP